MSQYFTILTDVGAAALANATALGQPIKITQFAVGDGGGVAYDPDAATLKTSATLANELYRGAVNELAQDPDNAARYYIEGVVPVEIGGWTAREAGWFLDDGKLFAVTKLPPSYKSVPADGAATELPIRTYLAIGSDATVTIKIDPTVVLATRHWVLDTLDSTNRIVLLTADNQALAGRRHRFIVASSQQLPVATDGTVMSFTADWALDLNAVECALVPPGVELIQMPDGNHDKVVLKTTGVEFTLTRINGAWRA